MSQTFRELGIREDLIRGLEELGILTPTQVQQKAISFLLKDGSDLVAQAQTGTGKTAAFGLPLLMKVDPKVRHIQGLVVAPTRELAKQIGKQLFRFTKHVETKIFVEVITGGDHMDRQEEALRRPTHIVVGTPGRIMDLIERRSLSLETVKHVVLDEADEMLSMGFKKALQEILKLTLQRQSTWLFSATFPEAINTLIKGCMAPHPHTIQIDQGHVVNRDIDHRFVILKPEEKTEFISDFLKRQKEGRGLIFCRTKADANTLCRELIALGLPVDVLQGDLMQKERDKVMRAFKKERVQFVVATDVAARGIDVADLAFVIHHQLPDQLEYYTHRSGRTARAGKKGTSLCLIHPKEKWKLPQLEKALQVTFRELRV
ncbi:DEAD/DEAH box helicase [Prosthecobacter dejongeii]|uniref:ATP-dependent RNA helicase DeaD n=1 Tax=Prosthecobacter dejongeii TaxID=48465 RepID=A0A7W7YL19_9BACT|nr:DEAD/DEAH box helicase [Prosthecobacter dejongeii]MBB5038158.1 ATP-dependent RNA helicase DeaD [Prosthecobacter dejongeii]